MELAAYDLLGRIAERARDADTAAGSLARSSPRSARWRSGSSLLFDRAVEASLRDQDPDDLGEQLNSYLERRARDRGAGDRAARARAQTIVGQDDLATAFGEHLVETREHARLIDERLQARGASPSKLKDAALRLGALNWGGFFGAQPDTPAKLAGFAYAFEHLEIGAYELLRRVAQRAGDTRDGGGRRADPGRGAHGRREAARLFDAAVDAALRDQEVSAR